MPYDVVKAGLRGVAAGLLTPFDEDLDIVHWKLEENAEGLYEEGIRTFLAAANISEYHALSQAERKAVVETSVDALPEDAVVLAGVGGSTGDAIDLIEAYDDAGADAMMVMPPDHTYLHERGLLRYYRELAAASDRPLVPYVRGFHPSVDYLADLTRVEGVAGIKYAIEDAVTLGAAVERGDDDVVWVDGLAEPFAPSFWAEGAEGFTAGVSNFEPRVGLALFDALSAGEWGRAREIRDIALPYQEFRSTTGENNSLGGANSVPAVKRGLENAGYHGGPVREPIVGLSPADRERADELYAQLEADIERVIGRAADA
ncbi:MAG: dihydrodipicolinate synthase family protein [Halobacteriales archaeon]